MGMFPQKAVLVEVNEALYDPSWEKCFSVLFGVPFDHGALPTFRFRMAY